jgi:hypothetical protein
MSKFYKQMKEINKRIFDLYLPDQQFLVKKALEEARQERYSNAMNHFCLGKFIYQ